MKTRKEIRQEQMRDASKRWRDKNPNHAHAVAKRWRDHHKENVCGFRQIARWRKLAQRLLLIQELGGKCVDCGMEHPMLLEFDHVDVLGKQSKVISNRSLDKMRKEAASCVLRCANCHRLKTWICQDISLGRKRRGILRER